MKKIKIRMVLLVSIILALVVSIIIFMFDKNATPPQDTIQELIKYSDNIAYLRTGQVNNGIINDQADIYITTELDERDNDKTQLYFIVKAKHRDFIGLVEVKYPARRDTNGMLMIGVPYRNIKVYVHTFEEYCFIFLVAFILVFISIISILIAIYQNEKKDKLNKSGKSDA